MGTPRMIGTITVNMGIMIGIYPNMEIQVIKTQ